MMKIHMNSVTEQKHTNSVIISFQRQIVSVVYFGFTEIESKNIMCKHNFIEKFFDQSAVCYLLFANCVTSHTPLQIFICIF